MSNYDQLKKVLNEIFELDKADLDFLPGQLWLAEIVMKHLRGNADVLLAQLYVNLLAAAVYDAGFSLCQ